MGILYRILFGSTFLVFGVIWIIPAQKTTFYCQRTKISQNLCQLTVSRITGSKIKSIPLDSLRRAGIQSSPHSRTYRVVLVTNTGEIPVSHTYDSLYENKKEFIAQINNFLKNKEEEKVFAKEDFRWMLYCLGTLFILPGIVVLFNLIPITDSEDELNN